MPRRTTLVVLALLAIAGATLTPAEHDADGEFFAPFCIVCGRHASVDMLANVLLFVPLGAALGWAGVRVTRAGAVIAATTLAIELAQYQIVTGRDTSIMDVATNIAGGLAGWLVQRHWRLLVAPRGRTAIMLAAAGAATWIGVLVATSWLIAPSLPYPPYPRWLSLRNPGTPLPPQGHVIAADLGGHPTRRDSTVDAPAARAALLAGAPATVMATVAPGREQELNLLQITTPRRDDILLLGRAGDDAWFLVRTRARIARLFGPRVHLPGFFGSAGDTIQLRGALGPGRLVLEGERSGVRARRELVLTPNLGWTMVVPPAMRLGQAPLAASVAWAMLIVLPCAYWSAAASAEHRTRAWWTVGRAGLLIAGLVAVPLAFDLAVAPWWEWAAAGAGLAIGEVLYRTARARLPLGRQADADVAVMSGVREATRFT